MKKVQLSDNLEVIKTHFDFTAEKFAKILKVSTKSITNYKNESLHLPKLEFVLILSDLTGLTIDKLLYSEIRSIDLPDRPYGRLPVLDKNGTVVKPLFDDFEMRKTIRELSDRISDLERINRLKEDNNE